MNGRVLPFEGSVHVEAERLLPWLVNGTLQDEECGLVEQHLVDCAQCQREVEWLRALQAQTAGDDKTTPAADTHQAVQRLRRRIDTERVSRRVEVQPAGWRRWGRRPWLQGVIAAQAAIILVLGIALIHDSRPAAAYRTLGAAAMTDTRLVVVFDPHLSEAQMRRLLRASDARIVDGPTDAGVYVLIVPSTQTKAVREALRAAPGVTLVEGLDSDRER